MTLPTGNERGDQSKSGDRHDDARSSYSSFRDGDSTIEEHSPTSLWQSPQWQHQQQKKPSNVLCKLVRQRDWQAVVFRLSAFPRDAAYVKNQQGRRTPLHLACQNRAPPVVIEQLIRAWPVAVWTSDTEGWIPLHVALLYYGGGAGAGAGAGAGDGSETESVLLQLIHAGGTAAAQIHSSGSASALHLACRHGAPVPILKALLQYGPEQLRNPNAAGRFPANLLWQQQRQKRQHPHGDTNDEPTTTACYLMECLQLMLQAFDGTDDSSLHAVVRFHFECAQASDFVGLYLQFHPNAARTEDEHGQLPLHVISQYAAAPPAAAAVTTTSPASKFIRTDPLTRILEAFPSAAAHRDHTGRLPLHLAVPERMQALVPAYPAALEEPCPVTRLYPFQRGKSLDNIHSLLRECPHVLLPKSNKSKKNKNKRTTPHVWMENLGKSAPTSTTTTTGTT